MQTSVEAFNASLEKSHLWLKELTEMGGAKDITQAYSLLRAVLHALRDWLSVEEAAHLGAQLPMLIRGLYYEGWKPSTLPHKEKTKEGFVNAVYQSLGNTNATKDVEKAFQLFLIY